MEEQNNQIPDCCSHQKECCSTQKKNSPLNKIIFLLIIIAMLTIVTIKLIGKNDIPAEECCPASDTSSCCTTE